jgi:uncharacterized membrane protein (UPF0127 family)
MLKTRPQRAMGAMLRWKLGERMLVFVYAKDRPQLFHTAFCRALRIFAFTSTGQVCFDQVVQPWRIVSIPPARWVVECNPKSAVNLKALFDTFSKKGEK